MDDSEMISLQIIILDTNALLWNLRSKLHDEALLCLDNILRCLVIFCNSHSLMHRSNRLCIISQNENRVHVIYPRIEGKSCDDFIPSSRIND